MSDRSCPACGAVFECGADDTGRCWCNDYPPVPSPEPTLDCLCPVCLAKALRRRIRERFASLDRDTCLSQARPHRQRKPLIEHLDYYVEDGLWVFTEWFHWKRGCCCGNACRHCPFQHEAVDAKESGR